MKKYIYRKQI